MNIPVYVLVWIDFFFSVPLGKYLGVGLLGLYIFRETARLFSKAALN